eukprot:gene25982-31375_t
MLGVRISINDFGNLEERARSDFPPGFPALLHLTTNLNSIFLDILHMRPKGCRVLVVEHPLSSKLWRDLLTTALLRNLKVSAVSFQSALSLACLGAGSSNATIVNVSWTESIFQCFAHFRSISSSLISVKGGLKDICIVLLSILFKKGGRSRKTSDNASWQSEEVETVQYTDAEALDDARVLLEGEHGHMLGRHLLEEMKRVERELLTSSQSRICPSAWLPLQREVELSAEDMRFVFSQAVVCPPDVYPDLLSELSKVLRGGGGGSGMGLGGAGGVDLVLPLAQRIFLAGQAGELQGLGQVLLEGLRAEGIAVPTNTTPLPVSPSLLAFLGASVFASSQHSAAHFISSPIASYSLAEPPFPELLLLSTPDALCPSSPQDLAFGDALCIRPLPPSAE